MKNEWMEKEREFSYWLCNIEGIGRITVLRLIREAGSAEKVYGMEEKALAGMLRPSQLMNFLKARQEKDVKREYQKLWSRGIRFIPLSDPEYPRRLSSIPDPPAGVYVRGELPEETKPAAAVIGARMCSEYGRYVASWFASALSRAGVNIISGLARGIDGISQEAAIRAGGKTYAVLGCGVDICYPEENRKIYDRIPGQGGILSEFLPGMLPKAAHFPVRNRIISGLSDVVLVVEARMKSGTLITVDMALEQGKEVFVVPGRITDALSSGCNELIRQGACMACSPDVLLEELAKNRKKFRKNAAASDGPAEEEPAEDGVKSFLDFTPRAADNIYEEMKKKGISMSLPQLLQNLLELQMEGAVKQEGGYFFLSGEKL